MNTHCLLSEQTAAWVLAALPPGAAITHVRPLKGGISSLIYGITVQADNREIDVVLRQIDNAEWLQSQPDIALQEAESLKQASQAAETGVPTPSLLAFDITGKMSGKPSVLMTRLEGAVVLEPADPEAWLDGLARTLTALHRIEPGGHTWTFFPYCDATKLDTSAWSAIPEKWKKGAAIVTSGKPAFKRQFIHRDYHPANVLWHNGAVSGVVDWVNGCVGPAGIDVGHCRVNLALLHGVDAADTFLARYLAHADAAFTYDPYWDLVTLIDFAEGPPPEVYAGWTALGVTTLTDELIRERLDAYLTRLLQHYESD